MRFVSKWAQRKSPGGHRAAVNAPGQFRNIDVTISGDCLGDGPLDRVIDLHIALGINTELAGESQHACVLAGAAIVNPKRLAAILDSLVMRLDFDGPMGAALVLILLVFGLFQHGAGDVDMRGLAIVGGAGERQFLLAKAKAISRARLDQRHTLKGLASAW